MLVKICTMCQTECNPDIDKVCPKCGKDLSRVKITDTEKSVKSHENKQVNTEKVKICDKCGAKNPIMQEYCVQCKEYIAGMPTYESISTNGFALLALNDDYKYDITDGDIIGRENKMQSYLESKTYVSRCHAKFIIREGILYIQNLNETNYTFVNNEKVLLNEEKELKDGDEIGLGGCVINGERQDLAAYFKVRKI